MAWSVASTTLKDTILTAINNALGSAAKISWQNVGSTELATTSLYAGGVPFTVSTGTMTLIGVPLTSSTFSASGCTQAKLQTSGSVSQFNGTVATSGADIQPDVIPSAGQQLRLDSLVIGVS